MTPEAQMACYRPASADTAPSTRNAYMLVSSREPEEPTKRAKPAGQTPPSTRPGGSLCLPPSVTDYLALLRPGHGVFNPLPKLKTNPRRDPQKGTEFKPLIWCTPVGRYLRFPWSAQRDGQNDP